MPSHKCEVCSKPCNARNAVMVLRPRLVSAEVDNMTMIWVVRWDAKAARHYHHVHESRTCLNKWLVRRVLRLPSSAKPKAKRVAGGRFASQ